MSAEVTTLEPELIAWLIGPEAGRIDAWAPEPPLAELQCHPDLVARLTEHHQAGRRCQPHLRRRLSGRSPPGGSPIAAACGTSWRRDPERPAAGDLARRRPRRLPDDWVELKPWPVDITFARGLDLFRGHVVRAQARAGAGV